MTTIEGFRVKQREDPNAPHFFVGLSTARDLLEFSDVRRLREQRGGIQRAFSESRARNITRFFSDDKRNVSPTAVTLALPPGTSEFKTAPENQSHKISPGTLQVFTQQEEKPATIVDGQHRLLGLSRIDETIPVVAVLLLDVDNTEQAFQFVVINNKASRVPPDLVRSLIADFNETELSSRLKTARISLSEENIRYVALVDELEDSPFYEMVSWDRRRGKGRPTIKPRAIEHGVRAVNRKLESTVRDEDTLFEVFLSIWQGARKEYPELWKEPEDCRLFENAGFKAFTEFITSDLHTLAGMRRVNLTNPDEVVEATRVVAELVPIDFWKSTWALKGLDTSAGLDLIKEDLQTIRTSSLPVALEKNNLNLFTQETEER